MSRCSHRGSMGFRSDDCEENTKILSYYSGTISSSFGIYVLDVFFCNVCQEGIFSYQYDFSVLSMALCGFAHNTFDSYSYSYWNNPF